VCQVIIEHGVIGVDVIVLHTEIEKFLIGLLFFCRIGEGGVKSVLKFCPEDFIILLKVLRGQEFGFQFILLFLCPVVNLGALYEREGEDDSLIRDGGRFLVWVEIDIVAKLMEEHF
jgi:hypothetical protein